MARPGGVVMLYSLVFARCPMPPRAPSLLVLGCTLLALGACAGGRAQPAAEARIRSVTLDAVRQPDVAVLEHLRALGVTHLTLVSFGHQPGYDVPDIRVNLDARWFSESDYGIRTLARQADSLGLRLILKPHIWVGRYSAGGQARHSIDFETEAAWQQWEAQYRAFLMHYAHLAHEVDAAMLVVGTELANVAKTRPAFWRGLIAEVRQRYGGALTYAANWWEEYEDVPFWDALDYIGVQAYFELSQEANPTDEMLRAGWKQPREALQRLSERTGRPVLFTEIGYRNVPDAAAQPWRWPSRGEADTVQPDDALQARLYETFFESVWDAPWFAGAILWKWYPVPEDRRRRRYLDFTPQNKPAEQVIARWFTRADAPAATSR